METVEAAAVARAHAAMLKMLYVHVLASSSEPVEEARACKTLTLDELEGRLELPIGSHDAGAQNRAIDIVERMFDEIIADLAKLAEPIPYRPAAMPGASEEKLRGDEPHQPDDGTPD